MWRTRRNKEGGSGIGVKDKQWNFDLIDLYDPPKLNKKKLLWQ